MCLFVRPGFNRGQFVCAQGLRRLTYLRTLGPDMLDRWAEVNDLQSPGTLTKDLGEVAANVASYFLSCVINRDI